MFPVSTTLNMPASRRLAWLRGFVPSSLPALMNDGAGYALAGDVVRFIDATWGRATLRSLTGMSSTTMIMAALNETQANLLARWRAAAGFQQARELP